MSDSLQPHGLQPARILCPWNSPGESTGVGCHSLLQGIFPTQGSNLGLPHCRQILYHLKHQNPTIILGFKICCCEVQFKKTKHRSKDSQTLLESNYHLKFAIGILTQKKKRTFYPFSPTKSIPCFLASFSPKTNVFVYLPLQSPLANEYFYCSSIWKFNKERWIEISTRNINIWFLLFIDIKNNYFALLKQS